MLGFAMELPFWTGIVFWFLLVVISINITGELSCHVMLNRQLLSSWFCMYTVNDDGLRRLFTVNYFIKIEVALKYDYVFMAICICMSIIQTER